MLSLLVQPPVHRAFGYEPSFWIKAEVGKILLELDIDHGGSMPVLLDGEHHELVVGLRFECVVRQVSLCDDLNRTGTPGGGLPLVPWSRVTGFLCHDV